MILLTYELITDQKALVYSTVMNAEKLDLPTINNSVLVETMPKAPDSIKGKDIFQYVNPVTKEIWYEFEDAPKTQEDLLKEELEIQANYTLDLDFRISKIELGL